MYLLSAIGFANFVFYFLIFVVILNVLSMFAPKDKESVAKPQEIDSK